MRVLILSHLIQQYRIPILRLLASEVDLTLATCKESQLALGVRENFNVIHVPIYNVGPFIVHHPKLITIVNKFDIVIGLQNLRCLDLMLLSLVPFRSYSYILWGIGVSASYSKKYDDDKRLDFLRKTFFSKADALLFYTEYPIAKYIAMGVNREKMFIALNTVSVISDITLHETNNRKSFLFVGSLYSQKGLENLIYLIKKLESSNKLQDYTLDIVGDGSEEKRLKLLVNHLRLESKVLFHGAIYDEKRLSKFFAKAILCLSPEQAGLTVLKSMGYGVCMVTKFDSITGGERLNIHNWKTGVLFKDYHELEVVLEDCVRNPLKFVTIGQAGKTYYNCFATPRLMMEGIKSAIDYVVHERE